MILAMATHHLIVNEDALILEAFEAHKIGSVINLPICFFEPTLVRRSIAAEYGEHGVGYSGGREGWGPGIGWGERAEPPVVPDCL
jgi:hypothetical protein